MTKINNLQKKMADGSWFDCNDRTEEFLNKCLKTDPKKLTEEKAIELLNNGETLICGFDWYDRCRIEVGSKPAPAIVEFIPDNEEYGY